jgi:hypothetical protein
MLAPDDIRTFQLITSMSNRELAKRADIDEHTIRIVKRGLLMSDRTRLRIERVIADVRRKLNEGG